jgi:hypothetical protein
VQSTTGAAVEPARALERPLGQRPPAAVTMVYMTARRKTRKTNDERLRELIAATGLTQHVAAMWA